MPYETPNDCFYDSDYAAALDIALDLIDHGSIEAGREEAAARGAPRPRDRLDARPGRGFGQSRF